MLTIVLIIVLSKVDVNMAVTTLGPVLEDQQLLVLTCYLRQSWTDPRLEL